jgi:WXG100 family type VII secretion target
MAEQVQANYEALNQIENRFEQLANEVQNMAARIKTQDSALRRGGWIGRGSDAFYSEMDDLVMPAVSRLGRALEEGGQAVNRIARIFSEAEEEAQSGFGNSQPS